MEPNEETCGPTPRFYTNKFITSAENQKRIAIGFALKDKFSQIYKVQKDMQKKAE
jgi:hypothetical protein